MSTTTQTTESVLHSLIDTCKDGQKSFCLAADHVRNIDFRVLFSDLAMQRRMFAADLQRILQKVGEKAASPGSFGGAIRRGWMNLKAAVTSRDEYAMLVECEREEDSAVADYRDALEHGALPASVRTIVLHQYLGVQAAHDRVRDLRDRLQG